MQFEKGAGVVTLQGQDVGSIERIVIDPQSKEVTHVVIRKGLLSAQEKVVPIDWIVAATEDGVTLRPDASDLQELPNFEEKHQVMANLDSAKKEQTSPSAYVPSLDWYPSGAGNRTSGISDSAQQTYITETQRNIPEGTVALKEGAKVVSVDDKHVGNVEGVLTHPETDQVAQFLVSKGLFLKERKLVPAQWVDSIAEDEVHLAVGSNLFQELRAHQE